MLLLETSLGDSSQFHGYLQTLPGLVPTLETFSGAAIEALQVSRCSRPS